MSPQTHPTTLVMSRLLQTISTQHLLQRCLMSIHLNSISSEYTLKHFTWFLETPTAPPNAVGEKLSCYKYLVSMTPQLGLLSIIKKRIINDSHSMQSKTIRHLQLIIFFIYIYLFGIFFNIN